MGHWAWVNFFFLPGSRNMLYSSCLSTMMPFNELSCECMNHVIGNLGKELSYILMINTVMTQGIMMSHLSTSSQIQWKGKAGLKSLAAKDVLFIFKRVGVFSALLA